MKTLDPEQTRALLGAAKGDRLEALYTLAVTTGMRQGEILGLRLADVDLDSAAIRVQRSLQRTTDGYALTEPKTERSRRARVGAARAVTQHLAGRPQALGSQSTTSLPSCGGVSRSSTVHCAGGDEMVILRTSHVRPR